MRIKLGMLLCTGALLFAFQNCGKALSSRGASGSDNSAGGDGSPRVLGSTSNFKKITYDPPTSVHIELSTDTGSLNMDLAGKSYSCILDGDRLLEAQNILATSEICEPGPLPSGSVTCMAIGVSDVMLSNETSSVQLQPVICHTGTFLCDGNDARLRSLLIDLKDNLPANCLNP